MSEVRRLSADATPVTTVPAQIQYESITVKIESKTARTIEWKRLDGEDIVYEIKLKNAGSDPETKRTNTNSILLRDLDINSKYAVSVTAINFAGRGAESKEKNFETGPNALSLVLVSNDGFTARIKWQEEWNDKEAKRQSCYVEEYVITWQDSEGLLKSAKTLCEEYTLSNLSQGASYSVWVAEVINNKRAVISNTLVFDGAPKMPTDLQVTPLESSPRDSLVVTFNDPNMKPMKYKVTAQSLQTEEFVEKKSERRTVLINGLMPGESYDIQVVAIDGELQSRAASYGRTAQTCPKTPEDVVSNYSKRGIKLQWKQLDIKPNYYRIQCEANNIMKTFETEDTVFFLDDVKFATTYRLKVAAVNKAGCSEFSKEINEITAPSPPTNVRVLNNPRSPETSFIVSFDDKNPPETTYEVVALCMEGKEVSKADTGNKSTSLDNLTAGHTYKIYVIATYEGLSSERAFYIQ